MNKIKIINIILISILVIEYTWARSLPEMSKDNILINEGYKILIPCILVILILIINVVSIIFKYFKNRKNNK